MSVVSDPALLPVADSVVTIGNFDGVHLGHQVLLSAAAEASTARNARMVAVTFDPHPAAVLRGHTPPRLQSLTDRIEALSGAGVDDVVVLEFTPEVASWPPDVFIDRVLGTLQAVEVVVGANFRFGHRAAGDVMWLEQAGVREGFGVRAIDLVSVSDVAVSSTTIRALLAAGDVEAAGKALGRPFALRATVVHGDRRGRELGFPTANLDVEVEQLIPADGVYASIATVGTRTWPAVTSIGSRPTFDGIGRRVETHLLDADDVGQDELYGHELHVQLTDFLRGDERFETVEALIAQMHQDVADARAVLPNKT